MFKKSFIFILLIGLMIFAIVTSTHFNYDEFKEKPFPQKMKYLTLIIFGIIEQYTYYFLMGLNVRQISEPYDFFCCFIAGCLFRIAFVILKGCLFKRKDNYIYNEADNTEILYKVLKNLNELNKNLKTMVPEDGNENNNLNNIDNNKDELSQEDIQKMRQIELTNKSVNAKMSQLENCMNIIEQKYNEEKNYNEKALKAIEDCQKFIKESLKCI